MEPRRRPAARRGRRSPSPPTTSRPPSGSRAAAACGSPPRAPATTPGRSGALDDTILLKTERMRGVRDRPAARTARVEAGVVWLDVVAGRRRARARGAGRARRRTSASSATPSAAASASSAASTAWPPSNVPAIELVTADGRLVRADREHEPDLFWALRGGGGSFGVVTAIEFELFPLTEVYAGRPLVPDRARRRGAARLARADPQRAAGRADHGRPVPQPPADPADPRARARQVVRDRRGLSTPATRHRPTSCSRRCARSGPSTTRSPHVPVPALSHLHMDPEQPVPGVGDGLMLGEPARRAIDAFVDGRRRRTPRSRCCRSSCGTSAASSAARVPATARSPPSTRSYALFAVGHDPRPRAGGAGHGAGRGGQGGARPVGRPAHVPQLRRDPASPRRAFWTEQAYQRLRRIKAAVDPGDMIRANHPIPPAR